MMLVQKSLTKDKAAIIKMIYSGRPLEEILHFIVTCIEKYCEQDCVKGSIMLYDASSNQLATAVSPSLSESFLSEMEPIYVSPYGGPSGIAGYLKKPVFVADIESNPLMEEKRYIAIVHGFRACWSIPLLSSTQELVGTIELYSHQIGEPDAERLKIITFFSQVASSAIAISRYQSIHSIFFSKSINWG